MGRPTDDVYRQLRADIISGLLAPGQHLVEDAIGSQFAVSRTPIRNAIKRLEADGLVAVESGRGAFVGSWTSQDAAEVLSIRGMLEPYAAALAAQRRTSEEIDQLVSICKKMETVEFARREGFRERLTHLNTDFHLRISEAARSPRLYNLCKNLTLPQMTFGIFREYDDDNLRRSLWNHRAIVSAIQQHDDESAHAMMNSHLRAAHQFMCHPGKGSRIA